MRKFDSPLDNLNVASPCAADWDAMYGDDRKRFCSQCKLNVYNLSGMTRDEAETLIIKAEGRLCVRFHMRPDGSIITQDCPIGWAKVKQRTKLFATAVVSLVTALLSGIVFASLSQKKKGMMIPTMGAIAIAKVPRETATPLPTPYVQGKPVYETMTGGLSASEFERFRPRENKRSGRERRRRR